MPGFNGPGWHGSSHSDDASLAKVVQWHYKKVEELALKMKSSTLPGGENLLDSGLISWGTGISRGGGHLNFNIHNVLIGKGGGAFKTGVRVNSGGAPGENLWNTVLHGFGLRGMSFGTGGTGMFQALVT